MKGLGARLRRTLDAPAATSTASPAATAAHERTPSAFSEALARLRRQQAPHLALLEAPGPVPPWRAVVAGREEPTDAGPLWVIEERLPLDRSHGNAALGALFDRPTDHLETLTGDPRLRGFAPRRALFVDIEATGLDHGAGTLAFIVGLGFVDGDAFVLRLLVLRDHSEERALLLQLRALLDEFPFLVSFNGKSYDLTVLQSRLVMHGLYGDQVAALKLKPHLDLLHLARNLYRGVWADTRLGTLETELLAVERIDDVPGSLVPSCWLAWLRRGDPRPIAKVVAHNRLDVLSMVTLADRLVAVSRPDATRDPRVAVNLGRLLLRRRALREALRAVAGLHRRKAIAIQAACYRGLRDLSGREEALRSLLALAPDDVDALTELAIVLERRRDLHGALAAARRAAALTGDGGIDRRVARIEARIARETARGTAAVAADGGHV